MPYCRITRRDLAWLDHTEAVPLWKHRLLWIRADHRDGNRLAPAVTCIADGLETDGSPLLRYITLLREGACARGLPEPRVRLLDRVESAG